MTNRNSHRIKQRKERLKEKQTSVVMPKSNNLWFWLLATVLVFSISYFSYSAYASDSTNNLIIPISAAVTILLLLTIWYLPKFYVRSLLIETGKNFDREKERLKLEDDTRKTFAQIVGGIVFLGGLIFTYNAFRLQQNTFTLQQEGQFTDRFTKAISQLGDDKLEIRLGGMYALERIAKDSPKDHWTIMEILSAFIREKAKKDEPDKRNETKKIKNNVNELKTIPELATDIQTALTIIGRRKYEQDPFLAKIDLRKTNLKGAYLNGLYFNRADFTDADLTEANLLGAYLNDAIFTKAKLFKARLAVAKLNGAKLDEADLSETILFGTELNGAFLARANLNGVQLLNANLHDVYLSGENFSGTSFDDTDLTGADLDGVRNLTFEQLKVAIIDENTVLPDYLENHKVELLDISKKTSEELNKRVNAILKE
jgi:hypothetical protein